MCKHASYLKAKKEGVDQREWDFGRFVLSAVEKIIRELARKGCEDSHQRITVCKCLNTLTTIPNTITKSLLISVHSRFFSELGSATMI
jgi:hypothetical protein